MLAGRVQEAFDLYWYALGNYQNLIGVLGESGRGLRLLEAFVPHDDFARIANQLHPRNQSALVNNIGLFAKGLGDLVRARKAFEENWRLATSLSYVDNESTAAQNLARIEFDAGYFPKSLQYSERGLLLAREANHTKGSIYSLAFRAISHFVLGNITAAISDFQQATELERKPLYSGRGSDEAQCKLLRGDLAGALSQIQANREYAVRNNHKYTLCECNILLASALHAESPIQADRHLQEARHFANRSGEVVLQLRCFHAACELKLHLGDYPQAITEAEAGILLADTCGLGKYSIDLRLALAETLLAAGDASKALQNARNALGRSEEPDCQYAWGKAGGLHFCGVAHLRLDERELARQRLTAALELRERLGHGRIEETRKALELCQ